MLMYKAMLKIIKISVLSGVGVGGYFLGRYHEYTLSNSEFCKLSEVNLFPKVYAASAFINDKLSNFGSQILPVEVNKGDVTSSKTPEATPATSKRISQVMKYGFPSLDNIRSFENFVLSYDRRNRIANWVFEYLTEDSVRKNNEVDRSKCEFFEDTSIHPYFRSTNADYKKSGFDRGHLAAAGNHKSDQKSCEQTFILSNMAPQVGEGFNRNSWNRLEKYVRRLLKTYPNVYVCTGPLYLPRKESDGKSYVKYQVIGSNAVAVPTHFFKVIVMEAPDNSLEMEAYVMPNQYISDDTPLTVFQVPPESIERASGLLLFDRLPKNKLKRINGKTK